MKWYVEMVNIIEHIRSLESAFQFANSILSLHISSAIWQKRSYRDLPSSFYMICVLQRWRERERSIKKKIREQEGQYP